MREPYFLPADKEIAFFESAYRIIVLTSVLQKIDSG